MNHITFKQYRNIDISIFVLLIAVSETIATLASGKWFAAQPVALSSTLLFVCMVMMRWGGWAIIHALIGGAVFCIASGAKVDQYLIYVIGNCLSLLALLLFKAFGKEAIRKSVPKLLLFTFTAYLSMQVGRWLISLAFGGSFGTLIAYLGTDVISLLFAVVVMLLMRNTDGMIEDQKAYLFRLERERKERAEGQSFGGYGSED